MEAAHSSALSTTSHTAHLRLARVSEKLHATQGPEQVIRLSEASITWLSSTASCKWMYYGSESFPDQNN